MLVALGGFVIENAEDTPRGVSNNRNSCWLYCSGDVVLFDYMTRCRYSTSSRGDSLLKTKVISAVFQNIKEKFDSRLVAQGKLRPISPVNLPEGLRTCPQPVGEHYGCMIIYRTLLTVPSS